MSINESAELGGADIRWGRVPDVKWEGLVLVRYNFMLKTKIWPSRKWLT